MNIDPQDIKIKIKLLSNDSSKTLAQASLTLFDSWTEKGWRVIKSDFLHPLLQEYIYIQSPCFRTAGGWKEMVFIDDLKLYEKLQEKIYDAYKMELIKNPPENKENEQANTGLSEKVANEIPF